MSALACENGPGATADILKALVASHQSSQTTDKPTQNLGSLMELAAAVRHHSSTGDGVAESNGQHQHQPWHLEAAAEQLLKYTVQQQKGQLNGACTDTTVIESAQEQKRESDPIQPNSERLNHRSSSRRRKPKVACSSAYGPNEYVTSHFNVKEEPYELHQANIGECLDDSPNPAGLQTKQDAAAAVAAHQHMEIDAAAMAAAAALMANGISSDCQQQQNGAHWGHHQLISDCYMDTADACYGQKQKSTAGKAAGGGRKRAGTNSSARSTASRGSSLTAAATAVATSAAGMCQPAAPTARQRSGSGGLSEGTDSGMLDDTLIDPSLDGSTAVAGIGLKCSNKQKRLKEKNRLAQRRFRARQKTMLEQMQVRMDELAKQVDQRGKDLATLHQENQVLKMMVQEQQKVLMVAMVAQQQQQHDVAYKSATEAESSAQVRAHIASTDAATLAADGSSKASEKQQFQQLQQMYQEHWQQQQLQQLQTAIR